MLLLRRAPCLLLAVLLLALSPAHAEPVKYDCPPLGYGAFVWPLSFALLRDKRGQEREATERPPTKRISCCF